MTAIKAKDMDGKALELDAALVDGLESGLRGMLLREGDHGYEDSRTVWNGMIDRKPALVARCLGTADVVTCVNFVREHNLAFTIKGGGHNIAGLAACDGGLMMDMSLMRGVVVDKERSIAHAQAGCILGDVDRETQLHGLAAVIGFVSNTGIAGLTLGGGFGYLSRLYGWTSDNTTAMEMVTADGRVVHASAEENADLYWGLRGGGGNFGVVTRFDYKLYPVGPEIMGGGIAWPAEKSAEVLDLYRTITVGAPPEMTCVAVLRIAPPAPWIDPAYHGKPIVALFTCDTGPLEEAKKRAARIKSFGNPIGDIIQPRPYTTQQSLLDATQPKGRRYYWKSNYVGDIEPELLTKYIDHAGRMSSPHSAILLFALGGAIGDFPADHSATGARDTRFVMNIAAAWDNASDDDAQIAWTRDAFKDMEAHATAGTYVNFLTEEEGAERIEQAYGANFKRLIDVKTKWDPGNLFRANKNIAPRR